MRPSRPSLPSSLSLQSGLSGHERRILDVADGCADLAFFTDELRCPVRVSDLAAALIALAGIGIIDLLPNRGAIVRAVTGRDIREICQVRRVLECQATRSACGRIDLKELHAVADQLRACL